MDIARVGHRACIVKRLKVDAAGRKRSRVKRGHRACLGCHRVWQSIGERPLHCVTRIDSCPDGKWTTRKAPIHIHRERLPLRTHTAILAGRRRTLINVRITHIASKTSGTATCESIDNVRTQSTIQAWIRITLINIIRTRCARVARHT